jgi:hypothetical protein
VAYVGVVGGGTHRSGWEVRLKAFDVEHVGKLDFGIEEASFEVRLTHDGTFQIHHRRHHHPYPFLSH